MESLLAWVMILIVCAHSVQPLTFDPDDYLEVYPDPRDPEVLKGRVPLYFSLIQSLGGPLSQFVASGSVAGVKIALDRINNDSSLLSGYTLHYTFANSQVRVCLASYTWHWESPHGVCRATEGRSCATEHKAMNSWLLLPCQTSYRELVEQLWWLSPGCWDIFSHRME